MKGFNSLAFQGAVAGGRGGVPHSPSLLLCPQHQDFPGLLALDTHSQHRHCLTIFKGSFPLCLLHWSGVPS